MNAPMRQNKGRRPKPIPIADRRATDLPVNSIVGEIRVVNPLGGQPGAMVRNLRRELEANPQDKIVVIRSLRDDPLARLHDRAHVDDVEYQAGRRWQGYYETTEIGGARGIDTTKDVVDGGRGPADLLTDERVRAAKKLALADQALGKFGARLVRAILGDRKFPHEVAAEQGYIDDTGRIARRRIEFITDRLRECLGTLAVTI